MEENEFEASMMKIKEQEGTTAVFNNDVITSSTLLSVCPPPPTHNRKM